MILAEKIILGIQDERGQTKEIIEPAVFLNRFVKDGMCKSHIRMHAKKATMTLDATGGWLSGINY